MFTAKVLRSVVLSVVAALAIAACQMGSQVGLNPPSPGDPQSKWVRSEALDFITGGGWFENQDPYDFLPAIRGARISFGWHGGVKNGEWWGNGNLVDHAIGLHVTVTSVTGYERLGDDGVDAQGRPTGMREICGYADTNLYGVVQFVVTMTDNGEPGRRDVFSIALRNPGGYLYAATGSLGDPTPGGGNVQLHTGNRSNTAPTTPPDCIWNPFG